MAAGSDLKEFETHLGTTTRNLQTVRNDVETLGLALNAAATASQNYLDFRKVIKVLDKGFSKALTSLSVSEKLGPLSAPSKALKDVLEVLQPRIQQIKEQSDRAKKIEPYLRKFNEAEKAFADNVIPAVSVAVETMDRTLDGINEFTDAFERVSTPNGLPQINPNAGTERPGKAEFTGLFDEADAFVSYANGPLGAAQDVFAAYNASKAKLTDLTSMFNTANLPTLNDIFGDMAEFTGLFDGLEVILDIVDVALRPIQPFLDAADAVFALIVDPVIDYLKDELGVDELFDALAAIIEPLFPQVSLFDGFISVADGLGDALDDLVATDFDIPDYTDKGLEVFDRFGEATQNTELAALSLLDGIPLRMGMRDEERTNPENNKMYGTGGDEAFDPGLGDDEVLANSGNDIIVASAGSDTIDGGDGIDRLVFAGELAEYDFNRKDDTGELVFTHTNIGSHGFNEGSETVTNVEYFDFATETFTKEQFENAIQGPSVLDGNGPRGQATTDEGELIFLQPGGELVDGLTLNGVTFEGMSVVYGLGGDDRIHGTVGRDFIFGGPGNDVLVPRAGADALDGGEGSDTYQIFVLDVGATKVIDLEEGTDGRGSATTTYLDNVENVIVQLDVTTELRGDAENNTLYTGAGQDMITGRAGNDALFGNDGRDVMFGGAGVDTLRGGENNDYLGALNTSDNGAAELYDGEGGADWLSYSTDRQLLNQFLANDANFTRMLPEAMSDARTTGPVEIRTATGEIDRLDNDGNVIATDIALNIEKFIGSDSDDVIYGSGSNLSRVNINGGEGNDTLYSLGARTIEGWDGDDLLIAQRGPDGGRVASNFEGGSGTDTLDLRPIEDVRFVLTNGTSGRISVALKNEGEDFDPSNVSGNSFNVDGVEEFFLGDNGDVVRWGTGGDGVIYAAGGDDYLTSVNSDGTQSPVFYGQDGNDTIILTNAGAAYGGAGDDRIELNSGGIAEVEGNAGNDLFYVQRYNGSFAGPASKGVKGGDGFDTLILDPNRNDGVFVDLDAGTALSVQSANGALDIELEGIEGIEAVITHDGVDEVTGSDNADRINLRGGNDAASGGDGNDQMFGGAGRDVLNGGDGNDTLRGGTGNDQLDGGDGLDTVDYSVAAADGTEGETVATSFTSVVVNLAEDSGQRGSERDALSNIENVVGTHFADEITGNAADNVLRGGAGADLLNGGGGNDVLVAGSGGIFDGVDRMNGDAGDDRFVIGSGSFEVDGGSGTDVLDFSGGTDVALGGGRSVSVIVDLKRGTVTRDVEQSVPVWADDGTTDTRSFDGQSIRPEDVLRSDPLYARSAADLNLRLPTGEETDEDIPSFAIEIATTVLSAPTEESTITGIEDLVGTDEKDFLTGNAANNSFAGGEGNDVLRGREGDDALNGGDGRDAAYFEGEQTRYTVSVSADGVSVMDRTGEMGTDALTSIELLDFETPAFGDLFDLEEYGGLGGLSAEDLQSFIELYIAYFNRAPDAVGLSFWGTAFANGTTLEESATLFIDQDETRATYPADLSNRDFATEVYNNVLGRVPDQVGFDFWVGVLDDGSVGRDQFILAILGGAKADPPEDASAAFVTQQQADQVYLSNKTDIGTYFAVNKGMSDVSDASAVMQIFDGSDASIQLAVALTDGFYADAVQAEGGEFLMQTVGVLDDPFA